MLKKKKKKTEINLHLFKNHVGRRQKAKFKINNLRFHFKRLEIKEEIKLKANIKEEIITARMSRIKNRKSL